MTNAIISKKTYSVAVNPEVFGYPEEVKKEDILLFAGIAYCEDVKKSATAHFLTENRIFTPSALQNTLQDMGLVPWNCKVESFSKKVLDGKIATVEKDGISFVYCGESTVPVMILKGISAMYNALRVRKTRNKKAVLTLCAELYWIIDELQKGKAPEQYQDKFQKNKEALNLELQYYVLYNPDVRDVPMVERTETHKKHGDFFHASSVDWDILWNRAIDKGKNAEIKADIKAKPVDKKTALLDTAKAFLDGKTVEMTPEELIAELARYIREN